MLLGQPLPPAQARHERLSKAAGLAISASDNLSSVAYASEEILRILIMLILDLAANTAFADVPRLAFFTARDGDLPREFRNRGDRLVFSIVTDVPYHLKP
jgi:hypothetical protein